jgi:DNA-directed RNA polymerase specialized sigma24 family protein
MEGFDLRLMSGVASVGSIPTDGRDLVIVAAVNNVLHFRIFDGAGRVAVDADETKLIVQAGPIEELRKQLEGLWPPHELTRSERDRVIAAVTSIVGHIRMERPSSSTKPGSRLSQIITDWSRLNLIGRAPAEPPESDDARRAVEDARNLFVFQYVPSIRAYAFALLKNDADAEDLAHEIMKKMLEGRVVPKTRTGGRYRDYLKKTIRNAARAFFRGQHPGPVTVAEPAAEPTMDDPKLRVWRRAIIDVALDALRRYQDAHGPNNHFHRLVLLTIEHPGETSGEWAARINEETGAGLTADAVRQQLVRARRKFADLLVDEAWRSLKRPTPERLEEWLIELDLYHHVKDFLPDNWRTRGEPPDVEVE